MASGSSSSSSSWIMEMVRQADLQELAQTAVVAVVFGFMLSKLVSMVMAIRSSMVEGKLRIERAIADVEPPEHEPPEDEQEREVLQGESSSSSDKEESVHSADSDGEGADVSGLSEGRADYSEVSEGGGLDETWGVPHVSAPVIASSAPEVVPEDVRETGYEPSTSSSGDDVGRSGFKPAVAVAEEEEDDTSDWEGVESTELDEAFGAASSYVATVAGGLKVSSDVQLQLYGLYKVATEGPCHAPQPSALKMTARAKWNAWQKLGNMSQEEAMEGYIELVTAISPDWAGAIQNRKRGKGGEGTSAIDPKKSQVGPVFSSLNYEDKSDEETLEALHVAARQGNESGVLELLDRGAPVDMRDSDGRTPLHWASDRGHLKIVELLLSRGADINAKDKESQTALHYASICEQENVAKLLVSSGADPQAEDGDGATPLSFCPTSWNSWMILGSHP